MTVNETLIVCKILKENGYGNYEITTECGFNTLQKYVWTINDDCQEIDMEGHYDPDIADEYDTPINRLIYEALAKQIGGKIMYITQCVVCNEELVVNDMKPHIPYYCKRYICEKCSQNNWKFSEYGVLINETPVKKRKKV